MLWDNRGVQGEQNVVADVPPPSTRRERARAQKQRRGGTLNAVLGVFGEIFLTVGVIALLYVSWQMWIGDWIIGNEKQAQASSLRESWEQEAPPTPLPTPSDDAEPIVPVLADQSHGSQFAVMHVPRFGNTWQFPIASGVSRGDILDQGLIGHYPDTAMPGEIGNSAYAAHRWTGGAAFDPIDKLVVGDAIVVETAEGWYTYRFRTLEYVQDTQVEVLLPVPQKIGAAPDERYLTLTSCAPKLNMLERIIAYAVFDEFTPRGAGAPAALSEGVST